MSEETKDASRTIPLVVLWAVVTNAAMLLIVGITFIFCLGDLDSVLNTATGQPVIQVFYNATQSVAGTSVMIAVIIIIFLSACVGQVATASRQMWSFARDQGKSRIGVEEGLGISWMLTTSRSQASLALPGWRRYLRAGTSRSTPLSFLQSSHRYCRLSTLVSLRYQRERHLS